MTRPSTRRFGGNRRFSSSFPARAAFSALVLFLGLAMSVRGQAMCVVDDDYAACANGAPVNWPYTGPGPYTIGADAFATIQGGVDAVSASGTVMVAAGTYREQCAIGKAVNVHGAGATVTIIDGTNLTGVAGGLVHIQNVLSGAVTLDGFTIRNAPLQTNGYRFAVVAMGCADGSSLDISYNVIVGTGYSPTNYEWGLYACRNGGSLSFRDNEVRSICDNSLLFELHTGAVEVCRNRITVDPGWGLPAIFSMSYREGANDNDVAERQYIHHNTINANGGSAVVMASAVGFTNYNERTNGKYTNVEIADNVMANIGDESKGVQLEMDGDNGGFETPIIARNRIAAQHLRSGASSGIHLLGAVTNARITDNVLSGLYRGIHQGGTFGESIYATNSQIQCNDLLGNVLGVDIEGGTAAINGNMIVGNSLFGVSNRTALAIDATNNWWGSAKGPQIAANPGGDGDAVSVNVNFDPWIRSIVSTVCDFDGDGRTDVALFRRANGKIWALKSSTGTNVLASVSGATTWIAAPGDYDGDGKADFAWFIPSTQVWRIYPSSSNYAEQLPRVTIGGANDVPIPADYDGDGKADIAVFRSGSGKLRIRYSSLGYTNLITTPMGASTWLPAPADYDGDKKADYSWFVPSTQVWRVYPSSSNYAEQLPRVTIGGANDVPIPGADFDGDGKADIAVFRRGNGKIRFIKSSTGAQWTSGMGSATWLPAIGDYDGDGKADLSWFIPSTQMWRVYESSNGYVERPRVKLGGPNDWPLTTPLLKW